LEVYDLNFDFFGKSSLSDYMGKAEIKLKDLIRDKKEKQTIELQDVKHGKLLIEYTAQNFGIFQENMEIEENIIVEDKKLKSSKNIFKSLIPQNMDLEDDLSKFTNMNLYLDFVLKKRIAEISEIKELKLSIGTYNVAENIPKKSLSKWLNFDEDIDIFVIGLQEIEMTAKSIINQETKVSADWNNEFDKLFQNHSEKYEKVFNKNEKKSYSQNNWLDYF
jgi:hypothetical protein